MRISLIMPNYNHAQYLACSIGGMLGQTRQPDEIIIIDDASTDASLEVITRLTAGHPHVRIETNAQQQGVVNVLNRGLALATGDYVAFLAADDEVYPDFLAKLSELLSANPDAGLAAARVEIRDGAGRPTGERPVVRPTWQARFVPPGEARAQLTKADNFFLGQVIVYNRQHVQTLGGFDATTGSLSDGILQRRLAVRWGYAFMPEVLGMWRVHGTNYSLTSVGKPETLEHMIAVARTILNREPPGLFPPDYATLFERRLRFNAARLQVGRLRTEVGLASALTQTITGSRLDEAVLASVSRLGVVSSPLATLWLLLRLRPYAWSWLCAEWFARATSPRKARSQRAT